MRRHTSGMDNMKVSHSAGCWAMSFVSSRYRPNCHGITRPRLCLGAMPFSIDGHCLRITAPYFSASNTPSPKTISVPDRCHLRVSRRPTRCPRFIISSG